jgi:hypothetical protein
MVSGQYKLIITVYLIFLDKLMHVSLPLLYLEDDEP